MTARFLALFLVAAPVAAVAQTPVSQAVPGVQGHRLEILDGEIVLDGVVLPDAVPVGMDLSGMEMSLDYSGPITPVVEVDEQFYVLEGGRLVRLDQSARAGERVYVLNSPQADIAPVPVEAMDDRRIALVNQEAYLREIAERDRALYQRMQSEQALERRVDDLGQQVRRTAAGAERTRLRSELRGRISDLFTLKQQIRREEVDRAQAEIDSARAQLDARDVQHDAIVDLRLRGLCGE